MPSKYYNRNFKSQHFYHIFNRGAYKNKIFLDESDYKDFSGMLIYYLKYPTAKKYSYLKQAKQPNILVPNQYIDSVKLIAYCLMPNHFHLILKQMPQASKKTGISNLMRRAMITYSMNFHYKYKHSGSLFESKYKNVVVDTNNQLLYLSKYIHQNPVKLTRKLENYPYSSLSHYLKQHQPVNWLYPEYVLKLTKNYYNFFKSPTTKSETKYLKELTLE